MNWPTYIKQENEENYHEQINQGLQQALSDNGWTVPQITAANLAIIAPSMPDGTQWYVTDSVPPGTVVLDQGVLKRFALAAYP